MKTFLITTTMVLTLSALEADNISAALADEPGGAAERTIQVIGQSCAALMKTAAEKLEEATPPAGAGRSTKAPPRPGTCSDSPSHGPAMTTPSEH